MKNMQMVLPADSKNVRVGFNLQINRQLVNVYQSLIWLNSLWLFQHFVRLIRLLCWRHRCLGWRLGQHIRTVHVLYVHVHDVQLNSQVT